MFDFSGMFAALIVFGVILGAIGTFGWPVVGLVALGFVAGVVVSNAMGDL